LQRHEEEELAKSSENRRLSEGIRMMFGPTQIQQEAKFGVTVGGNDNQWVNPRKTDRWKRARRPETSRQERNLISTTSMFEANHPPVTPIQAGNIRHGDRFYIRTGPQGMGRIKRQERDIARFKIS